MKMKKNRVKEQQRGQQKSKMEEVVLEEENEEGRHIQEIKKLKKIFYTCMYEIFIHIAKLT